MSASKACQVLDLIRGEDVQRAAEILNGTEREAAEVIGKVLASAVANAAHNDRADPRGALRLGLLRRRGHHHEALAPPGARPGHLDPQAVLPHHHHRDPFPGRPSWSCGAAHGGGQRHPLVPGRRLASPCRPVAVACRASRRAARGRRPKPRPMPGGGRARGTTRQSTDRGRWPRRPGPTAEPEVTEARHASTRRLAPRTTTVEDPTPDEAVGRGRRRTTKSEDE